MLKLIVQMKAVSSLASKMKYSELLVQCLYRIVLDVLFYLLKRAIKIAVY